MPHVSFQKPVRFEPLHARCAIHAAERSSASPALIKAFRALDVQLHDLRSEFLRREAKLRQEYLDRVARITSGE